MATFTKLRSGEWGIRGPVSEVVEGQAVKVTKKSGETKTVTVGCRVWTDGKVALATIAGDNGYVYYDRGKRGRSALAPRYSYWR